MSVSISELKSPLYQRHGGALLKILPETSAEQVRTVDGSTVEARLTVLSNAVAGRSLCHVAEDIAARDLLEGVKVGDQCWVRDAADDATVNAGAAKYIYESAEAGWVKTAEAESMDVVVDWADIQNKPASAAADIADAVTKRHAHANKSDLDRLTVSGGQVAVDGAVMKHIVTVAALPESLPADLVEGGLLVVDASVGA